ncbi:MAG: thiamine pyrophosphate-dependent dehydrogenase E1 component subunit alpha, partial [Pyrinomonadaceae bacterium]|nr:thiamine pyrophosphate-dependent dehydrogenase E1 component subunit alpha [Pyrinomonadaceae bacterium]
GGVFSSLGQEATAVGTALALETGDFICPLIRDIGAVLTKGILPRDIFAQYMAKRDAPSGAKDLQFHFADLDKGFIGPISHLGDMLPVLTGVLLAARMRKNVIVGACYLGEGATSTGAFHEGINFAAVQKLPLIVIIENNGYAYSTPTRLQAACENFADKAIGYGISSAIVDGNDVIACYETMRKAVDYCRAGNGAFIIESKTYRRKGHAEHDNQSYVPPGEIEFWEQNDDPISRYERYLLETEIADDGKLSEIATEIETYLQSELEIIENSPAPEPIQAAYNVFDNSIVAPAFKRKLNF